MAGLCCADSDESTEKERWNTTECWAVTEYIPPEFRILVPLLDLPLSFSFLDLDIFCEEENPICDIMSLFGVVNEELTFEPSTCEIKDISYKLPHTMVVSDKTDRNLEESEIAAKGDNPVSPNSAPAEEKRIESWGFELVSRKSFQPEEILSKKRQKRNKRKSAEANKTEKKKWKDVSLEEVGIYPSLFPRRPVEVSQKIEKLSPEKINDEIQYEFDEIESKLANSNDLELYHSFGVKEIRADRDKKMRKAHKQVKDKYCWNVKNNNGKDLYVHHRVCKQMGLRQQDIHYLPNSRNNVILVKDLKEVKELKLKGKESRRQRVKDKATPPVATETRHALHSKNAPTTFASDDALVNLLISLQHRELSPEDYDLLLRLDEQVAPKTLSKNILESFKTDNASESDCCQQCAVCMENYTLGQLRKYLPCEHVFHANCIDMWLENSSMNCPLDGLPVS